MRATLGLDVKDSRLGEKHDQNLDGSGPTMPEEEERVDCCRN